MKKDRGVLVFFVAALFIFSLCITSGVFAQKGDVSKDIGQGTAEATGEKTAPAKTDKAKMDKSAKKKDVARDIGQGTAEATGEKTAPKSTAKTKARMDKSAKQKDVSRDIGQGTAEATGEKTAPAKKK
jgi:hypothetical protein